jgi:hypothetical protein
MSRQHSSDRPSHGARTSRATYGATDEARGKLSVREAGRKGGLRVRELINRGREVEARQREQPPH